MPRADLSCRALPLIVRKTSPSRASSPNDIAAEGSHRSILTQVSNCSLSHHGLLVLRG